MDRPFERILIANRGEIACRIIEAARDMDIATIAIYSDADCASLHAKMADMSVRIGGNTAAETYMDGDKIIEIALRNGVQAIHPGYGFLSENAAFAKKCADNHIKFIGPSAETIELMGSKSSAKAIMVKAGVPVVPGYYGHDQSDKTLKNEAQKISVPFLIKATYGGGGRGMRLVEDMKNFDTALNEARSEGEKSFGSADVLIERYLTEPRHIEVQIFSDTHGNTVHLYERDCSVQRRHQKVIEEAPAPNFSTKQREAITSAAVKAAEAVHYEGAGTVEFLLDKDGSFYFMEMNTRLQVEHPVTEMITGEDLVAWQLVVAAGAPLPRAQENITCTGHSFECRLYAEDPENNFAPSIGHIGLLEWPEESTYVRIDTGIEEGANVSPYYDAMLAKIIVWGEDRDEALDIMYNTLSAVQIAGVKTNNKLLKSIVCNETFMSAKFSTSFMEVEKDNLALTKEKVPSEVLALAVNFILEGRFEAEEHAYHNHHDATSPWNDVDGWRMNSYHREKITLKDGDQNYEIFITYKQDDIDIELPEEVGDIGIDFTGGDVYENDGILTIMLAGQSYELTLDDPAHKGLDHTVDGEALCASMPGTLTKILVKKGQKVEKGAELVVMEAMKMEQTYTAPYAGIIKEICFKQGQQVAQGSLLIRIEE
ncbi:MAG: 3-methylcrotonyl-CoA carboxylase alpha subunit [Alphaproteobacteria bacterium]|jgi:3-methylcrotonyl-CoA carboxylase alpha subunit